MALRDLFLRLLRSLSIARRGGAGGGAGLVLLLPLVLLSCNGILNDDGDGADCDAGEAGSACDPCPAGTYCDGSTFDPTPCGNGTWDDDQDASTACVAWTDCVPGERVGSSGSATADRTCEPCGEGTYSTSDNARSCTTWTACQPGTYIATEGSSTSNQACLACPTGTYSTGRNAESCDTWTDCVPGEFVSRRGSTTRDRICSDCPTGQTTTTDNAQVCTDTDACPAGTAGPNCDACDVGTYCAGGTAPVLPCASGTWDHDANPASACEPWTDCVAGQQIANAGSATVDRTCESCPSGTFSSNTNTAACATWSTCAAGTRVATAGTPTADQTCETCPAGTYATTEDASDCDAWTTCPAGDYVSTAGSTTTDQVCDTCPAGSFTAADNTATCTPFGSCPAGTVQTAAGTPTSDVACDACSVGSYCVGGTTPAAPCEGETWDHDANPATACEEWSSCPPGTTVGADGDATTDRTCDACPDGTYTQATDATACDTWTTCGPGTRVDAEGSATTDRQCAECASGTFNDTDNVSACTTWSDCGPGTYVLTAGSATADRVCEACAQGTYSDTTNASQCVPIGECAPGTVQTAPGDETNPPVCETCEAGEYCPGGTAPSEACGDDTLDHDANPASPCEDRTTCAAGNAVLDDGDATTNRTCTPCLAGTFSTTDNAPSCEPLTTCSAGSFVEAEGSSTQDRTCTTCEGGTFTDADNQTSCDTWSDCAAGTFVETTASASNDRGCAPCEGGTFTDAPNQGSCTTWTTCTDLQLAPGTATADAVCAALDPCDQLTDEDSCRRSLSGCSWDGSNCTTQPCDGLSTDPDLCSRIPGCEFDYTGSFSCGDDPTPPTSCDEITNSERCANIGLGCAFDTDSGDCVDIGVPTDCVLGDFSDWSDCSRPCDGGLRFRQQEVLEQAQGGLCDPAFEEEPCNTGITCSCDLFTDEFACDFEDGCTWNGSAGSCEEEDACGDYTDQVSCDGDAACAWDLSTDTCVDAAAPRDCAYSAYSDWSACSLYCDGGTQTRTRTILQDAANGGAACDTGTLEETRACNSGITCLCESAPDETQCLGVGLGCQWDGTECDPNPLTLSCEDLTDETDCNDFGYAFCFWFAGSCRDDSQTCADLTDQTACETRPLCDWDGATCGEDGEPPLSCADVVGDPDRCTTIPQDCAHDAGTGACVDNPGTAGCDTLSDEASCNVSGEGCVWDGAACQTAEAFCGVNVNPIACVANDTVCEWDGATCVPTASFICAEETTQPDCEAVDSCTWDLATDTCVGNSDPRDCVYSDYGAWSPCSVQCEVGEQSRTRTIVQPAANGGSACDTGTLTQTQSCFDGVECVCSELPDATTCGAASNCSWDGSACGLPPNSCGDLATDVECLTTGASLGCIWIGIECISGSLTCSGSSDQPSCEAGLACNWDGSTCVDDVTPPSECADIGPDQGRCEASPLNCNFDLATQTCQDAPGTTTTCSSFTTEAGCNALPGCLWFLDSECIAAPSPPCTAPDQASCEFAGACDWDGSSCVADPDPTASCFDLSGDPDRCNATQLQCTYDADAGVCRDDSVSCDSLANATDCEGIARCDWDAGACADDPTPPTTCGELTGDPDRCLAAPLDCNYDLSTDACVDDTAPLDCVVTDTSAWSDWSTCSLPCEGGEQTRTRTQTVLQDPLNGGADCPPTEETQACNTGVPCVCSELTEEQCPEVTTPECSWDGNNCIDLSANQTCDAQSDEAGCLSFPDDRCVWLAPIATCLSPSCSSSSTQGDCESLARCDWDGAACADDPSPPATCAELTSDPDRCDAVSIGGPDCAYDLATSTCVEDSAPRDCVLGPWSDWSTCSLPCQGGSQTRTRAVLQPPANGGAACGPTEETQHCNTGITCVCDELVGQAQCEQAASPECVWDGNACGSGITPVDCDTLQQSDCEGALGQASDCVWVPELSLCFDVAGP